MRVIYSEKHALRDAETELYGGQLVPPFEAPFRAEWILKAAKAQGHKDVVAPEAFDLSVARKLHDEGYLAFMATVWERWLAEGFKGEAIPTCFPARRMQANRPPRDVDGALGYYAFAAETAVQSVSTKVTLWPASRARSSTTILSDMSGTTLPLGRPK